MSATASRGAFARLLFVMAVALAFVGMARSARADENPWGVSAPVRDARLPPYHRLRWNTREPEAALPRIGAPLPLHPLVNVARRFIGSGNFTGLHAQWCAAALRRWLAGAGYSAPASNRAIDFAHYGRPTRPHVGAIMVMAHHVGVIVGMSARGPLLLSGNHGRRVGIGVYAASRAIAFREPV